jgi:iron(III) transport system permease protein
MLLLFAFALLWVERHARSWQPQTQNARRQVTATRTVLAGWRGYVATFLCLLPIFFDFILPTGILVR